MSDSSETLGGDRLAKVIARAGLCSRRDAEDWIRGGRVSVNGTVIRTPAFNVTPRDRIAVDGEPLSARSGTRVWLYHKPPGLVVTEKDPEGRPTIFEKLAEAGLPRVLTVGRLDLNTEGLLLLTNDGGLKRVLELPATGWLRRYRVRAFGRVTQAALDGLKDGIEVEGVKYGPIEATLERQQGSNVWLVVSLREGKNREVKNVLAALGLQVNRLIRVSYGPFQLGDLAIGAVEVVKSRVLRDQLGKKLADAAGADFESEVPEAPSARDMRRAPAGPRRPAGRPGERGGRPAPTGQGRPRRIFFDDGRPPEEYQEKPQRRGRREDDEGSRGSRPEGTGRPPVRRGPDRPQSPAGRPGVRRGRDVPERASRSANAPGPQRAGRRPDRDSAQDRPERPPRPTRDGRPGGAAARPGRPSRPDAPARPPRPAGAGRPSRPTGTGRPSRPGGAGRPSRPGGGTGRPSEPGSGKPHGSGGGRPPRKPRT